MIDRASPSQSFNAALPERAGHEPEDALRFADRIKRAGAGPQLPTLADGSPPPESAHPIPDQAKVFNENGFFAAPEPQPEAPLTAASPASSTTASTKVLEPQNLATDPVPQDGMSRLAASAANSGDAVTGSSGTVLASRVVERSISSMSRELPVRTIAEPRVELMQPVEAEGSSTSDEVAMRLAAKQAARAGGQSPLRIAIRDIERGLQILVTAQALNSQERERLQHEIAAMLSRHGLVPHDVRIARAASSTSSGRY